MRKFIRYNLKCIVALFALLVVCITMWGGLMTAPSVYADTSGYSDVLTDLQTDGEFNAADYSDDINDFENTADYYAVYVIQVAESESGELFIYTHQPCQKIYGITATQINMSLDDTASGTKLYDLTLLSVDGVFAKYKVDDFTVSDDAIRYYNISTIYRDFIAGIDVPLDDDNTLNAVAFAVGKLFTAITFEGKVEYFCKATDVVEILDPYVDFFSYYNGMDWEYILGLGGEKYTDVHYIAFSTDRQIDTLREADVTYRTQSYKIEAFDGGTNYGELSEPQFLTLTGETTGSTPDGFLAQKYTWKGIQTTEEFISSTGLTSGQYAYEHIKDTDFVLVFLSTSYEYKEVYDFMQGHSAEITGTKVSNVSILRLEFETNGITYDLGAVMNQQEGDNIPGNAYDRDNVARWWAYVIIVLVEILVLYLLQLLLCKLCGLPFWVMAIFIVVFVVLDIFFIQTVALWLTKLLYPYIGWLPFFW